MLERLTEFTATLLGRSAYQKPPLSTDAQLDIDSPAVVRMREQMGGQLQLPTTPQTRWYLAQLEAAEYAADSGNLEMAAKLMRAARTDGVFAGVLSTRTHGLVRLPKRFRGDADVVAALELGNGTSEVRSDFDDMCPPAELAQLAADGILLGVAVGELVPVAGRDYPVLVRHEPQWLVYQWHTNQWFFRSVAGLLPITPGDGRWVLHTPGGRTAPWANGIWRAIGRAFIRKEHASLQKDNWEGKLANPARVAVSPQGAGEMQKQSWFQAVMAWGINTVFGVTPGYDVRLLESNGRGFESFNKTIADQNNEMIIAVAGQVVTVTGGSGFSNQDVHKSIRADLIKGTADDLAYTMNTQVIPTYVACRWGEGAINTKPGIVEWDATPPKDRNAEATALVTTANAIKSLREALGDNADQLDVAALCTRFGVPVLGDVSTLDVVEAEVIEAAPPVGRTALRLVEGGLEAAELPDDAAEEVNATIDVPEAAPDDDDEDEDALAPAPEAA